MKVSLISICGLLLLTTVARGQGQFGDIKFRDDVNRAFGEIKRASGSTRSERNSSNEHTSNRSDNSNPRVSDEEDRRQREIIAAAKAAAKAEREREREKKLQEDKIKKAREQAARQAKKDIKKAGQVYARAHQQWKQLFDQSWDLEQRWRYITSLLDVVQRDGARLVWGLDGQIDMQLQKANQEFQARADALRKKMTAYSLLFADLRIPIQIDPDLFLHFDALDRAHLAAWQLKELQDSQVRLDQVRTDIEHAAAALERESAELATATRTLQKLVETARESSRPWLVARWKEITTESAGADPWRGDVLQALRELREPPSLHRPEHLGDLRPGDVMLLGPGGVESKLAYVVGIFMAGRELSNNPAAHALTFIGRDATGRALFLDHTAGRGSHIVGETEFRQEYASRKKYVARPQSVVNGRVLLETAIDTASKTQTTLGSRFGLIGEDKVCSEEAAFAVGKATGTDLIRKRIASAIDVHPSDFFDDQRLGWYFVVSPMKE